MNLALRLSAWASVLAAMLALGACAPATAPPATVATAAAPDAPQRSPRVVAIDGVIVGLQTVPAVITLRQAASAEMRWAPVTIGYATSPELVDNLKVGDHVAFDLELGAGGYILAAHKAPSTG